MKTPSFLTGLLCAAALAAPPALAAPITYTFAGQGAGTLDGTAFTDGSFVFSVHADTSAIDAASAPFYYISGLGGSFTQGSFSATLATPLLIVGTADTNLASTLQRINLFNADVSNGVGMIAPALASYHLDTSIGPLTTSGPNDLLPTFDPANLSGFGFVGGGSVTISSLSSLTFSASLDRVAAVPEPASWALLVLALPLMGAVTRRRAAQPGA